MNEQLSHLSLSHGGYCGTSQDAEKARRPGVLKYPPHALAQDSCIPQPPAPPLLGQSVSQSAGQPVCQCASVPVCQCASVPVGQWASGPVGQCASWPVGRSAGWPVWPSNWPARCPSKQPAVQSSRQAGSETGKQTGGHASHADSRTARQQLASMTP